MYNTTVAAQQRPPLTQSGGELGRTGTQPRAARAAPQIACRWNAQLFAAPSASRPKRRVMRGRASVTTHGSRCAPHAWAAWRMRDAMCAHLYRQISRQNDGTKSEEGNEGNISGERLLCVILRENAGWSRNVE